MAEAVVACLCWRARNTRSARPKVNAGEEVVTEMVREDLAGLCVAQIMQRWPATIAVFMNCDLHCVGCPVGSFHTLAEAAEAHGIPLDRLMENVEAAIAGVPVRDTRRQRRRRSAAGDEHP